MNWGKARRRILAVLLALTLWAARYARPGHGNRLVRRHKARGQPAAVRFGRAGSPAVPPPPGNLFRELFEQHCRPSLDWAPVLQLTDRAGRRMRLQIGAGKPCDTSLHTGRYLPMSLPGSEEAAQSLAERLRFLLEESESAGT